MKKMNAVFSFLMVMTALIGMSFTTVPGTGGTFKVKTSDSHIQWKGYKVTGEHYGVVNIKEGQLTFDDNGQLNGGSFTIDMSSIKVLDMQGEYAGKLEGHLKSADFFGVDKHPTAQLEITKVTPKGTPNDYKIIANLTIKNITQEIRFYAKVEEGKDGMVTAKADLKIDRTDFDVRYGSGNWFENLGDKTIYDEFDLNVALTAAR